MKTSFIFTLTALAVVTYFAGHAESQVAAPIDLLTPYNNLSDLLAKVEANPLQIDKLLDVLIVFLSNCLPASAAEIVASVGATLKIELPLMYPDNALPKLFKAGECNPDVAMFMQSADFEDIHIHLWADGDFEDWHDVIEFIYYNGLDGENSIYTKLQDFYTSCNVTLSVPAGPRQIPPVVNQSHRNKRSLNDAMPKHPIILAQECNLLEILKLIHESNLEHLTNLIKFILIELSGDHSVHFLAAKVSETSKGITVRRFRQLDSVKTLIHKLDIAVSKNPLFVLIETITGINVAAMHLAETIANLAEYIIWRSPFPIPV